ncbi:MAG TPA: hypothetical protein ENO00_12955 [Deltaproteobacteria bacterium]|nr:hypothetical protein [Deltaproteobacteria bacterium]
MMEKSENKLIPILRQGIAVIQMILFKRIREHLVQSYPERDKGDINKLSGAIVNDLFGTTNMEEPFATFVNENKECIEEQIKKIPQELSGLMIPLTDALRVTVICDRQDGIDNSSILQRAHDRKLLLVSREVPLPGRFINLVRELGDRCDILLQPGMNQVSNQN